jgi:hypothetical protein
MGNFSKNPITVRNDALAKGYDRVLFQQGKPVLDRELNLLADLVSPQRLIEYHIGNGVPDGDDGFKISGLSVAQNDFSISAGRCLVAGHEVKLESATTYKTQPHAEHVAPLPAGTSYAYLHVFTSEVDHTQDSDLNNPNSPANPDVGMETAVRRKVEWEVIVTTSGISAPDHMLLAVLNTVPPTVTDRRRTELTVASLRDEVTTARGSLARLDARLDVSLNGNGTLANGATVTGDLIVNGKLGIGTPTPEGVLHVSKPNAGTTQLLKMGNQNQPLREWSFDIDGSSNMTLKNEGGGSAFTALFFQNSGDIGVGTSTPTAKLEVAGTAKIAASLSVGAGASATGSDSVALGIQSRASGVRAIAIGDSARASARESIAIGSDITVSGAGSLGIRLGTGGSGVTVPTAGVMAILEGNVGVGIASPSAKLQISGGALMPAIGNSASAGIQFPSDPGGGSGDAAFIRYFVESGETTKLLIGCTNDAADRIGFYQFGGERLTIYNGNVGVGTSTPTAKLEVAGTAKIAASLSVGAAASATGSDSVALGIQSRASGVRAIAIGDSARASAQESIAIGSDITVSGAGSLGIRLGAGGGRVTVPTAGVMAILEGNLGVGTASPSAKLQVSGGALMPAIGNSASAGIQFPSDPGGGGGDAAFIRYFVESGETTKLLIGCTNDAADRIGFYQFGGERLTIYNGRVGIGTVTPGYPLDVHGGDLMIRNGILRSGTRSNFVLALQGDRNLVLYDNGHAVWASGTHLSDVKFKKDIVPIKNSLDKIMALRGVCFSWKDESFGKGEQLGMVAQEVEEVIPQMVTTVKDTKLVQYQGLVPVLIEAIKEQQREIELLKSKFESQP